MDPRAILRAFAQLALPEDLAGESWVRNDFDVIEDPRLITPVGHSAERPFDRGTVSDWSLRGVRLPVHTSLRTAGTEGTDAVHWPNNDERVLAAAALHQDERRLRVGWVWFAGVTTFEGAETQFCFPAISVPVARTKLSGGQQDGYALSAIGDPEATTLIANEAIRDKLLAYRNSGSGSLDAMGLGNDVVRRYRLNDWIDEVAKAVGITISHRRVFQDGLPTEFRSQDGISMVLGNFLYLDRSQASQNWRREFRTPPGHLSDLAEVPSIGASAFAKIYSDEPVGEDTRRLVHELRPMSARQRQVASNALAQEVSVLSGPPGTGKSHLVTVAALDAISRGQSVLVAASSHYAVDVLVQHFADSPGPTPVVFGGSARSQDLADELAAHGSENASDADRAAARTPAISVADRLADQLNQLLRAESVAVRLLASPDELVEAKDRLKRAGDLGEIRKLIRASEKGGLLGWNVRRRSADDLARRLGDGDPRSQLSELRVLSAACSAVESGGLTLDSLLDQMVAVESEAASERGELITKAWIKSLRKYERATLREIATAMSSSRSERRELLRGLLPARLVRSAPLWVGSVEDIDDVLPSVAAMFDLVILDEAAQIDQIDAAVALVRARNAIVVGDPNQLGHTRFLSKERVEAVAQANKLDADRINPSRGSILDVVGAVAPTQVLDEHFRSAPHLIEFSARRIYDNSLSIVTRHPSNEAADHIDVHVVAGQRNGQEVNEVEVEECLRVADEMIAAGQTSIGFISPFRAQADALEEAVLAKFSLEEIDEFGLRVGTVHSFQGDERDVIITSWAVGPDEAPKAWNFVNSKSLFNVMVTRARTQMVVVTSTPKPPGLAGEYVRWAEPLTDIVTDVPLGDAWVQAIASSLTDAGVPVRSGYQVGGHIIDLVAGVGENAVAIDCVPHADGPTAHIDRALQLRRMNWQTTDCFVSKWYDREDEFAVELVARFPTLRP